MKLCYHCQRELVVREVPDPAAQCPYCGAHLRCCHNCRHYSPAARQQCLRPDVDWRKDKKAANECPEFVFREIMRQTRETQVEGAKRKWDDIFRDL